MLEMVKQPPCCHGFAIIEDMLEAELRPVDAVHAAELQ
jgi:hypothetical protein